MASWQWKNSEALWWSLFAAGGVLTALAVPALVLATGFVLPTTDEATAMARYDRLDVLLSGGWWQWLVRLGLFVLLGLGFFHCAHRIRHTLADLGLRRMHGPVGGVWYGVAGLGTLAAAWVVIVL